MSHLLSAGYAQRTLLPPAAVARPKGLLHDSCSARSTVDSVRRLRNLRLRQKGVFGVNYFCRPVASLRNVTEPLAPGEQCLSGKPHR